MLAGTLRLDLIKEAFVGFEFAGKGEQVFQDQFRDRVNGVGVILAGCVYHVCSVVPVQSNFVCCIYQFIAKSTHFGQFLNARIQFLFLSQVRKLDFKANFQRSPKHDHRRVKITTTKVVDGFFKCVLYLWRKMSGCVLRLNWTRVLDRGLRHDRQSGPRLSAKYVGNAHSKDASANIANSRHLNVSRAVRRTEIYAPSVEVYGVLQSNTEHLNSRVHSAASRTGDLFINYLNIHIIPKRLGFSAILGPFSCARLCAAYQQNSSSCPCNRISEGCRPGGCSGDAP